jgi:1-acyl-sn-glycerol-3-phosphate acyltransferase
MIKYCKAVINIGLFIVMSLLFIVPAIFVLLYKNHVSVKHGELVHRQMRQIFFKLHDWIFWRPKNIQIIWRTPKPDFKQKSIIVIGNHQSFIDTHFLATLAQKCNGEAKFLMNDSIKWIPLWGWYAWFNNYPLINQSNSSSYRKKKHLIESTRSMIKKGHSNSSRFSAAWACFPEGTRFKQNNVQKGPFKYASAPKIGSLKQLISLFDESIECLDVTLKYHPVTPSWLDFFLGKCQCIEVWVDTHQLSTTISSKSLRLWLHQCWQLKDKRLGNNA